MSTLVVQLGHCFRTQGATGTPGEQEFAHRVGDACVELLHGVGGWRVRLVLADDHDPARLAGDLFVAVHADGSLNPNARGASVGYRTRAGQLAGQAWKRAYQARGWGGGFRDDNYTPALGNYYGVREAVAAGTTAAFILEAGFLTNPGDRGQLRAADGAHRVALALGDVLGIRSPGDSGAVREEEDMRFIQGDGPRPYSDFVFKVWWPEQAAAPTGVRVHVPSQQDPGFRAALATGAGMDPRTGRPHVMTQGELDRVPFASTKDLEAFKAAYERHLKEFQQQQQRRELETTPQAGQ